MPSLRFSFGKLLKKWVGAETKFEKTRQLRCSTKLSLEAMEDRVTPAGELDPSFGAGGKLLTDFNTVPSNMIAQDVAVQADGKILVAGNGYLIRLNFDGSFDNTFGDAGATRLFGDINALTIDSMNRIVVAGKASGSSQLD
jgi:uncharacterized delta-60 repeat protein